MNSSRADLSRSDLATYPSTNNAQWEMAAAVIEGRNAENAARDHLKFRAGSSFGYPAASDAPLGFRPHRWLDEHGRYGEPYKLGFADEEAGTVTVIDAGTYSAPHPWATH